ncbi:hypothetical protein [Cognatilysobacter segetis]|uniref:hypothetical protein n=1 Tax=Cognatilysobacter segetis TaxID=2492394 RepID=UPI00105F2F5B|nr:hypothetical protein [Lysobacter segetis]
MTLPWSGQQVEWLQAMGLDVLQRPAGRAATPGLAAEATGDVPAGLLRAARGVDLAPLLARLGLPRDVASRRAFWRELRALRKAAPRA